MNICKGVVIAMIEIKLLVNDIDYEKTAEMLNVNFVLPDIREGEISLSALWEKLYVAILKKQYPELPDAEIKRLCSEKYPIPEELDFRQNSEF